LYRRYEVVIMAKWNKILQKINHNNTECNWLLKSFILYWSNHLTQLPYNLISHNIMILFRQWNYMLHGLYLQISVHISQCSFLSEDYEKKLKMFSYLSAHISWQLLLNSDFWSERETWENFDVIQYNTSFQMYQLLAVHCNNLNHSYSKD